MPPIYINGQEVVKRYVGISEVVAAYVGAQQVFSSGFSPLDLTSLKVWYDPSDLSTMFQDSAGTTPVTADGQSVGLILDKSGNNFHAYQTNNSWRPVYKNVGGIHRLRFDGINKGLMTDAINLTTTDKLSVFAGVHKSGAAAQQVVAEFSPDVGSNNGAFLIRAPSGSNDYTFNVRGDTASVYYINGGYAPPIANVLSSLMDLAGATLAEKLIPRINGVVVQNGGSGGVAGGGNFGNYSMYIGRRNNSNLPFEGDICSLIIQGAISSAGELASVEQYVADKTGVFF